MLVTYIKMELRRAFIYTLTALYRFEVNSDRYHWLIQDFSWVPCVFHLSDSTDQILIGESQVNSRSLLRIMDFPGVPEVIGFKNLYTSIKFRLLEDHVGTL